MDTSIQAVLPSTDTSNQAVLPSPMIMCIVLNAYSYKCWIRYILILRRSTLYSYTVTFLLPDYVSKYQIPVHVPYKCRYEPYKGIVAILKLIHINTGKWTNRWPNFLSTPSSTRKPKREANHRYKDLIDLQIDSMSGAVT